MKIRTGIYAGVILLLSAMIADYLYLVYLNNRNSERPALSEIDAALSRSLNWVFSNKTTLLNTNNPALWSFLNESVRLTGNEELKDLVNRYRYTVLSIDSVWGGYFGKTPPLNYTPGSLDYMEDYQKFLVYGLSCNKVLADEEAIRKQLNIHFCDWRPYYSSCSTHQLMGIDMLSINGCSDDVLLNRLTSELVDKIENQLAYDPRVGDVYIQRALMLFKTGHREKINNTWIRNILDEQRPDGGWASFYCLFNITDEMEFGFAYKFPAIRTRPESSFHTTAQAIYLLSLEYNDIKSRQN